MVALLCATRASSKSGLCLLAKRRGRSVVKTLALVVFLVDLRISSFGSGRHSTQSKLLLSLPRSVVFTSRRTNAISSSSSSEGNTHKSACLDGAQECLTVLYTHPHTHTYAGSSLALRTCCLTKIRNLCPSVESNSRNLYRRVPTLRNAFVRVLPATGCRLFIGQPVSVDDANEKAHTHTHTYVHAHILSPSVSSIRVTVRGVD